MDKMFIPKPFRKCINNFLFSIKIIPNEQKTRKVQGYIVARQIDKNRVGIDKINEAH